MVGGENCVKASNSCSRSGSKRVIEEIGDELELGYNERSDFVGGNCGMRKIRVLERNDGEFRASRGVGLGIGDQANEEIGEKVELEKMGSSSDVVEEGRKLDFDLNESVFGDEEFSGSLLDVRENAQLIPVSMEVINISSDESEGENENFVAVGGKGKEIEKGDNDESKLGLDLGLDLGKMEVNQAAGESNSMGDGRRYTREEKGKEKLVQSWISLCKNSMESDLGPDLEEQMQSAVSALNLQITEEELELRRKQELSRLNINEQWEKRDAEELELRRERELFTLTHSAQQRQREAEERLHTHLTLRLSAQQRQREAEERQRTHRRLARPLEEDGHRESLEKEQKAPSVGIGIGSENFPNHFSTELNVHRERISKQKSAQQLIRWKPSEDRDHNISKPFVPSLLDLSLKVLADNADTIVSLEAVPDVLKRRLSNLLCDFRKMNVKTLDLFVRGSPAEIRIKDCSWITENQFTKSFESFDPRNLRVCCTIKFFQYLYIYMFCYF